MQKITMIFVDKTTYENRLLSTSNIYSFFHINSVWIEFFFSLFLYNKEFHAYIITLQILMLENFKVGYLVENMKKKKRPKLWYVYISLSIWILEVIDFIFKVSYSMKIKKKIPSKFLHTNLIIVVDYLDIYVTYKA